MTNSYNAQAYIKKSGTDYVATRDEIGMVLDYAPNGAQIGRIALDNTDGSLTSTFALEDAVNLYIDAGSGGVEMIDGYIWHIDWKRRADLHKYIILSVADFGGYLAPKTVHERRYWRNTAGSSIFTNAGAAISGLSTAGVSASITETLKPTFLTTQVKDVWDYAGERCGADWFCDETRTLNAFLHNSQSLQTGGNTYILQDSVPNAAHKLMVMMAEGYQWSEDALFKFNKVTVENSVDETKPPGISDWITNTVMVTEGGTTTPAGIYGWDLPEFERTTGTVYFRGAPTAGPSVGNSDERYPAVSFASRSSANAAQLTIVGAIPTTGYTNYNLGIPLSSWSEINFYIWPQLSSTPSAIVVVLVDNTTGNAFYRDIGPNNTNGTTGWTFHSYSLPAAGSATSNGWTNTGGTVNNVDEIQIIFYRTGTYPAGNADGYTAGGQLKIAIPYFWRIHSQAVGSVGSPPTHKVIGDRSLKTDASLLSFATKEQARTSVSNKNGFCTILGNTDFKRPGYVVTADFSATLGKSGTVRLDHITHIIQGGRYTTKIEFSNAYMRL